MDQNSGMKIKYNHNNKQFLSKIANQTSGIFSAKWVVHDSAANYNNYAKRIGADLTIPRNSSESGLQGILKD